MKSFMALGLIFLSMVAHGDVVVSKRVVILPVDLSTAGIRLSKAGYSIPTVKVLIPELADVTLMNHRNEGETAPCLATLQTFIREDVVQGNPTVELLPFTIELEKVLHLVTDANGEKSCNVNLVETVQGMIRGFDFSHVRTSALPSRHPDDCK